MQLPHFKIKIAIGLCSYNFLCLMLCCLFWCPVAYFDSFKLFFHSLVAVVGPSVQWNVLCQLQQVSCFLLSMQLGWAYALANISMLSAVQVFFLYSTFSNSPGFSWKWPTVCFHQTFTPSSLVDYVMHLWNSDRCSTVEAVSCYML